MKFENDIDKLFKEKLSYREFEIEDSYLADLNLALDKRKTGWIQLKPFLFSTLLITFASFVGYFVYNSDNYLSTNEVEKIDENLNKKIDISSKIFSLDTHLPSESSVQKENNFKSILNAFVKEKKETQEKLIESKNINHIFKDSITSNQISPSKIKKDGPKDLNNLPIISNKKVTGSKKEAKASNKKNSSMGNKHNLSPNSSLTDLKIIDRETPAQKTNFAKADPKTTKEVSVTNDSTATQLQTKNINKEENLNTSINDQLKERSINSLPMDSMQPISIEEITKTGTTKGSQNEKKIISQSVSDQQSLKNDTITPNEIDSIMIGIADSIQNKNAAKDSINNTDTLPQISRSTLIKTTYKKWNVSAFVGPTIISKSISGDITSTYFNKRKSEEKAINTFNLGLNINYFLTKNINLSAGLNFITYGENIEYAAIIEQVNKSVLISQTQTNNQDTTSQDTTYTPVYSNLLVNDTIIQEQTNTNRSSYLHVPIMVGYRLNYNKISVNIRMGGSIGFLIKANNKYINTQFTAIESSEMKKVTFNLITSTVISYPLNKIDVFIEPKYQFKSSNFLNKPSVIQSYSSLGVNFGVLLKF